ncbi:MAG: hypothetical protein ACE15F_24225 [bacterium]
MPFSDLYGVLIDYYMFGVYDYREVIVDKWSEVMKRLDTFTKESTRIFVDHYYDSLYMTLKELLSYWIEEFDYLDKDVSLIDVLPLIVEEEIKRSKYLPGTPYKSRRHWEIVEWALDGLIADGESWFTIKFEGPLPDFIKQWFQYEVDKAKVYPTVLDIAGRIIRKFDYELIGKLALFIDIDESVFEEAKKGFFEIVDKFNEENLGC